jgi:hypothetical protein
MRTFGLLPLCADFVEKLSAKRFEVHRATRCRGYGRDQLPIIVAPSMDSEFFNKICQEQSFLTFIALKIKVQSAEPQTGSPALR